jgi:hypothetical protein
MARRTIHARRASPYLIYLVIAFAVLMVGGWVGFGYMYSLKSKAEIAVFGQKRVDDPNANIDDMWDKLSGKYKDEGTLQDALEARQKTVVDFQSETRRLMEKIAGDTFANDTGDRLRAGVSDVIDTANSVLTEAQAPQYVATGTGGPVRGVWLDAAIHALMQRIDGLQTTIKRDAAEYATLKGEAIKLQASIASINTTHEATLSAANARAKADAAGLALARDNAVKTQEQLAEDVKRLTDTMLTQRKAAQMDKDKQAGEINKLQNDLKAMAGVIATFRKVPSTMSINGQIVEMGLQGQVAYGDLGKKDGILLGLTFSIFSPIELGKAKPEPKAQCRVVRVMNESCELRIYEIKSDNPVIKGDLLYNPVYDRTRRLHFAMVGRMDIENNMQDETEQLKGMIQEFGGKIDPAMTIQTDFLIVGDRPIMGPAPGAGASPMEL